MTVATATAPRPRCAERERVGARVVRGLTKARREDRRS